MPTHGEVMISIDKKPPCSYGHDYPFSGSSEADMRSFAGSIIHGMGGVCMLVPAGSAIVVPPRYGVHILCTAPHTMCVLWMANGCVACTPRVKKAHMPHSLMPCTASCSIRLPSPWRCIMQCMRYRPCLYRHM
jgi:hypothetical protein